MYLIHKDHKWFLSQYSDSTLAFTSNYQEAITFDTIGDAMGIAGELNTLFCNAPFKILRVILEDTI